MRLNGKVQCIEYCTHRIVAALNTGGIRTADPAGPYVSSRR